MCVACVVLSQRSRVTGSSPYPGNGVRACPSGQSHADACFGVGTPFAQHPSHVRLCGPALPSRRVRALSSLWRRTALLSALAPSLSPSPRVPSCADVVRVRVLSRRRASLARARPCSCSTCSYSTCSCACARVCALDMSSTRYGLVVSSTRYGLVVTSTRYGLVVRARVSARASVLGAHARTRRRSCALVCARACSSALECALSRACALECALSRACALECALECALSRVR